MTFQGSAGTQASSLATRCYTAFSPPQKIDGHALYNQGRVQIDDMVPGCVQAFVTDREGANYVCLAWAPGRNCRDMEAYCGCREYANHMACPHLWALIQEMDRQGISSQVPGKWPIRLVDPEPDDEFDISVGEEPRPSVQRAQPGKMPEWSRQLRQVREASESFVVHHRPPAPQQTRAREFHYLLSVEKSLDRGRLVVMFYQREARKNGSWGKLKQLRLDAGVLESVHDGDERYLLGLLLAAPVFEDYYRYYSYGNSGRAAAMIPPSLFEELLPRLCSTGRFAYSNSKMDDPENVTPLAWDNGPPWRFELNVTHDAERPAWRIEGSLKREETTLPLSEPLLLMQEGLVVLPGKLARLDAAESFGWVSGLRRSGVIYVPLSDKDKLVEELWQIPALPPTNLDAELKWEQITVVPQPRMRIGKPRNRYGKELVANVTFDYDGHAVGMKTMQSGLVDRQRLRVVMRDRALEQDWIKRLYALGFKQPPYYHHDGDLELPANKLPTVLRELMHAGWQVEAEGQLIRRPGEVRLSVTSNVDWFDLEGVVDFEGVSVALPALLQALRRGAQFVTLGDGTQGMLPEEWLKKYGLLADLGDAQGDKLRFVPSQAAILDALLAAQPQVEIDEQFEEVRARLRSFQGVQAADPPQTFQGTLRDYQTHGLGWLHFLRDFRFGGCLADDMGLGKTVQVLALLEERRRREVNGDPRRPSLAVVPRSLVFNWIEEAKRFTPELKVLNYTGLERKQSLERLNDYDLLITTYGTLRRDVIDFQERRFDYAILDEAQAIKNASSQAAKACRLIQADYRLAMSGTPIENHLGEIWSLFEFLNPGMLGRSSTLKLLASGAAEGDNRSLLAQALRPFILRRTKSQVLKELPEKTEQTLYCELDETQRKLYNELRDHYRAALDKRIKELGIKKSKIHVLEALLRLRQAACHPGLLDKAKSKETSAKLETLLEQLSEVLEEGHKVLVFSQFTSLLAIVRQHLDERKITYEYLDGRTRDRQQRVERFQNDEQCRLFLISLKAGGQGLNLTAADYVFILDPWWNPAVEAQAVDRAHRIGQERPVFAYRLIARDTVEEKILELQGAKRQLADAIISEDNSVISSLTSEDLQLLLS